MSSVTPPLTVSHVLGEVVWLMTQSKYHKHLPISDLELIAMPPILAEQFRIFRTDQMPIGVALWAFLSPEAEARLIAMAESGAGARLRPEDWKSGDRAWLVEIVAPQATPENNLLGVLVDDLAKEVFPGRTFKFHLADPITGVRTVREMGA